MFKIDELKIFWVGVCSVEVLETTTNPKNKREETKWALKYSNIVCKRVYKDSLLAKPDILSNVAAQTVVLLMPKEYDIPVGAKIIYKEDGIETVYRRSGIVQKYPSVHQQIFVENFIETQAL